MKKLLSRKTLLETPIFKVTESQLIDPGDRKIRRILVEHGGSTVVLPQDDKGRILLVKQYRYAALDSLWELPAGGIEPGETALEAAKRELREETGYSAKKWQKLITFFPSPGFQQEQMTIYLARKLKSGERQVIEDEDLIMKWFSESEVRRRIRKGRIRDAKTIIGMYALDHLAE